MKFEDLATKIFLEYKSNGKFSDFDQRLLMLKGRFLDSFLSIGLPTFRNEEWKYTNLSFLNESEFDFSPELGNIDKQLYSNLVFLNGDSKNIIHLHNGTLVGTLSGKQTFNLEKTFKNLDFLHSFQEQTFNDNPFLPLNFAMSFDGFVLKIPDETFLEEPLTIFLTFDVSHPKFFNTTNFIKVGNNSKINLILIYSNLSKSFVVTNDFIGISQGKNSNVEISLYQEENSNLYSFSSIHSIIESNSIFRSNTISLGPRFARNNLQLDFIGEHSEAFLNGIYYCQANQFVDNHTLVQHLKPFCHSNQNYRGVLEENGRAVFSGKIFVERGAQKTNAYQSNKNILLSDEARVNTKPQLEIYADDVKCTHGATAGFLDAEAMFYLRSRGINLKVAKALLLNSFVFENLVQIGYHGFRDFVKEKFAKKLNLEEIFFCSIIDTIKESVK